MKIHKKGFTLVELIVVITILAILGSIAFIAMQGYTKSARDSQRIADVGQFRSGIEIFQVEAGTYPMPDNVDNSILVQSNPVNYPGTTGELSSSIARMSDAISDPATLEEYDYAIEGNKKSYQLTYSLEDDGSASILNEAHAADFVETVVVGNYNGVFAKTETGAMLTMPSLFAKHSTTGDVDYTAPTALDFTIPGQTTPVSYTPVAITSYTDTEDLITQIQSGYDNTVDESIISLEKVSEVNVLVASDTSSQETFESGYLGQTTTTSGGGSTPTCTGSLVLANATVTNDTGLSASTPYQNTDNTASCYFECTGSYTGMDCGGTDYAIMLESGVGATEQLIRDVAFDTEGNMFVTGHYRGTSSVEFGNVQLPSTNGNNNIFIAKIDNNGNVLWANGYGANGHDHGYSIVVDDYGYAYLAGYFSSPSVTFGEKIITNNGGYDIFIAKIDNNGNVLWAKNYPGNGNDFLEAISIDDLGNIYVVGYFNSSLLTFGGTSLSKSGSLDIFVAKIDNDGNPLWAKSYGGVSGDSVYGRSLSLDDLGNIYVVGHYNGASLLFGGITLNNNGNYDIFVAKLDNTGNVLWANSYGGSSGEYLYGSVSDPSGNVYITGYFPTTPITIGGISLISNGSNDIFLVKIDNTGNVLWAKSYGGSSVDTGYDLALDVSGNIYLTGNIYSSVTIGGTTLNSNGNADILLLKIDKDGDLLGAKNYGGNYAEDGFSIAVDQSGNIGLGGYYKSSGFDLNGTAMTNNDTGYWNGFATKFYMQ